MWDPDLPLGEYPDADIRQAVSVDRINLGRMHQASGIRAQADIKQKPEGAVQQQA
tara:strand:- start:147 stop:311 length:165 start_codon:yes stop_codon:yes gene_type:complete